MIDRLVHALVVSKNGAADDLLLQAVRLGVEAEQRVALDALLRRKTARGLSGLIGQYADLPESLQAQILRNIGAFHHALAECGRSPDPALRLSAMRLVALGRQGKLAYVLSENLHEPDPTFSKAATEGIVALARWVATETRRLQRGIAAAESDPPAPEAGEEGVRRAYEELMAQRPEIEAAVARAINVHRGKHGPDLLRAALLLADWPGSKTLEILHTPKHGGQGPMVRRLRQPPDSEHVDAFLLGATYGQIRSHFGTIFSHIDQAPVLDALLRRTHWLKDNSLQISLHQVTRGAWWGLGELTRDIERRPAGEAAKIAEWLARSGLHDVEQDERLQVLLDHANRAREEPAGEADSLSSRLRLLRVAMGRRRGTSVMILQSLLADPDERIVRIAAREIVRRKPPNFENMLLKVMTAAPPSVRRVMGRAIGQAGFDQFWNRYDRLDKGKRKQAGRAMLKLLPDAIPRLQRRTMAGMTEHRIKAMQIIQELGIADALRETLVQLCTDGNPRVRSKAVTVLGEIPAAPSDLLIERLLNDADARVRANVIEVLEARQDAHFLPLLTQRATAATSRERANAIKAMYRMKVGTAGAQLLRMLRDERADHRISAMWALRQIGWWQLLNEVGKIAKGDADVRARRYALGVLKTVAELLREQKKNAG